MLKQVSLITFLGLCVYGLSLTSLSAEECYPPCYGASSCDPLDRCWGEAEYLYWSVKDSPEPVPFVVESLSESPVLNSPGSTVVLGNEKIKSHWRSGGRFSIGYWFDHSHRLGAEINYLMLPDVFKSKSVSAQGLPGSAFLSAPYFNVITGLEDSVGIALPGVYQGFAKLKLGNCMQNSELNLLAVIPYDNSMMNITLIAGFRYWNFDEELSFKTNSPNVLLPDIYFTQDKFHASNNFYGGQIGVKFDCIYHYFTLSLKGKVALGSLCHEAKISGLLTTNDFSGTGIVQTFSGGYFTMPSNIGKHKHCCFAVIPEANVNLGCQITDNFSMQVGYSFLFVNNVLWAANTIDREINPTQSTALSNNPHPVRIGEKRPRALSKLSNFWAQGINVGMELTF